MADKDINDTMMDAMIYSIAFAAMIVGLGPFIQRMLATTPLARHLEAQAYQGKTDPKEHTATEELRWIDLVHEYPYTPWISAYFINDGPDAVEIAINYPNDRFTLNPMETVTVTRTGAQERIAIIFFKCAEGETASVRIIGEY